MTICLNLYSSKPGNLYHNTKKIKVRIANCYVPIKNYIKK